MSKKRQLLTNVVVKGIAGFSLLGLLLFGCAGSLSYTNAWILIGSLFFCMLAMGMVLLLKYPKTLERRLQAKESNAQQKGYVAIIGILFLASFALAGLDHRFRWSNLPFEASMAALAVMLIGYGLYCAVVFQNSYASRIVEVQKGQAVISTGLYAVVRHPMYLASLLLFLSMPFVLGSFLALIPMLFFPIALVLRIKNEEAVLLSELKGYSQYVQKTKYRLIPFLW